MPASRIAFALADFVSEIRSLLPPDDKVTVIVRLDSLAFDRVVYQLREYGAALRYRPADAGMVINHVEFGGVRIERITVPEHG